MTIEATYDKEYTRLHMEHDPREHVLLEQPKGFTHHSIDNRTVEWWTPKWIFDALGLSFDLDPCSPSGGVPWLPAAKHYSLPQDGLTLPWHGNVWLNPPYGKHTGDWLAKMHQHRNGVALVFARTDCRWFHEYVVPADRILFLRGRIRFVDGMAVTKGTGAGAGSLLTAWGNEQCAALDRMAHDGHGWAVSGRATEIREDMF
jgi:hypothetical protein